MQPSNFDRPLGWLFVYIVSVSDANHSEVTFLYAASILFYIPILFYLFMSLKYLIKKIYLRSLSFLLVLILILSCYYFPNKSNKNNLFEIFEPYFTPWISANKYWDEFYKPLKNAQKDTSQQP